MNHRPRKRFGQNFLRDEGIVQRIVDVIGPESGQRLVEIGPGEGAITLELLRRSIHLQAIELDRDLIAPLAARCAAFGELTIHQGDALKFDYCRLAENDKLRIVGNLPYNISTPLLFHLLDQSACIADMHFMLQKEVVARMGAEPGSKLYGRLSVMLQVQCDVEPLFDIPPQAFQPAPKVDSAFVRLTPFRKTIYELHDQRLFSTIVSSAFSLRRKTLRNSLRKLVPSELMERAQVDPGTRAERLEVIDFVRLANRVFQESKGQ